MDSGDFPANMEIDAGVDMKNENREGMVDMDDGDINDLEDVLGGGDGEKHLGNGLDIDLESDFHSQLNDLNRSSGVGLSKPIWSQPDDENGPLNGTANGHDVVREDNIPEDIEVGGGEGFIDPDVDIATEGSLDLDVQERGDVEPEEELDFEVPDNHHHMSEPFMPLDAGLNLRNGEPEPSEQEPLQDQMQEQEQDPLEEQLEDSPEEETLQDPPTECFYDEMGEPYQSPVHEPFQEPYQEQIQDHHHEQIELKEPFQVPEQDPIHDKPEETEDHLEEPFQEPQEESLIGQGQEPLQAPSPEPFYDPVQVRGHDNTPIISVPVPSKQEPVRDPRNEPVPQEPLLTERYQGDGDVEIPVAMEHQHLLSDDDVLRDDEAGAMTEGSLDLDVAVGEHVEEDDDADVFENNERYESPTPPTYVNTTIVSNASSSLEPAPAHAQCLIARSPDDVSGDVIVQEGGGSGKGSGRIPTRVDDIGIAVEPTAETKLLDHKGNGDAFVPVEVVRKGFPPPFPIGYSDENLQKGNWGHKMEFMCAIFCIIFNIDSFIQFPYMMVENGGVVFLIPYMIILFLLILPLILSEISLGQFASSSFLTCWKFCPLLKGLSMGMLLQLFGLAFLAGPFSSHSLYYIYSVFLGSGDQIIYTACGNTWNDPGCKSLIPPPVAGNGSLGNYTTTEMMVSMESSGTDGMLNWTNGMLNGTYMYDPTSPEEQYYRLCRNKALTTEDLGAPVIHLMICLGVAWAIAFFIMLFGIKSFGKVAYMLVGFHILLLFVLLVRGAVLDNALDGVKLLFWPEVNKLLDPKVWSTAMRCAMLTFMPMCGIYMSLGGYNKFHNNCFMDSVVLILLALFINLLSAVTLFTYVGYGDKLLGLKVLHISDHSTGETIFVTLAMLISTLPHARIVSFILFFFSFLSSLGLQIVVALSIVIGFLDAFGCRHSWKTVVPASFLVCVACFGGGLLFITPEGPHFWSVLYKYFLPHIPFVMSIIVPLALTWVYGTIPQWKFLRFQRDIKCMVGCFPIVFQGLFAGLEALIVPLVMGVAWVYFLYITFNDLHPMYEAYQGWHIAVAIIVAFVPLIIGFLSGAVMELCKHLSVYRYFTELFWLASMPLREWGPAVDELREEHGYPPLNKEDRDDLVEEYRENAFGSQNINNANDNNSSSEVRIQPLQQGRSGQLYTPYSQGGGSYPPSPRDKQEMVFAEDRSTSNDLDQSERDNPVNSNATLPAGTPLLGLSLCSHETTL